MESALQSEITSHAAVKAQHSILLDTLASLLADVQHQHSGTWPPLHGDVACDGGRLYKKYAALSLTCVTCVSSVAVEHLALS